MKRRSSLLAFTLIEMITVIAIIAILAGLILSVNGLAQRKAAVARTTTEIKAISGGCESYKTDMGGYPQDANLTDTLDPRVSTVPTNSNYQNSSKFLYGALTGDDGGGSAGNAYNGKIDSGETPRNYLPDFFKASRFDSGYRTTNKISYVVDPFGYSYGYSTAGLKADQDYRVKLVTDSNASRPAAAGYNTTFDLWSTGGSSTSSTNDLAKWIKNW